MDKKTDHEPIDESILGTAKINPDSFKATASNPDRLASAKYAFAGLIYMFRREQSTKALTLFTGILVVLLVGLQVETVPAALVVLSIGLVWMAEFLNSAVEAVVDLATDEIHPMAKVAKDVASAAVLVGLVVNVAVVLMVLGPIVLEKLGG